MREGHAGFVIRQNGIGGAEAIREKRREPMGAKMDMHLIGTDLDPSHQNEKDDPLPQYRHRRPIGGMRGRVCDQALLQQSLTGLRSEDLE
jgi:hypothetical protein